MEMHQVRYFLAVARTLNFTRAAEECNVAQPSLTRAVKLLEDELGGALFRRERPRAILTPLGERMLPLLHQCFDSAQSARVLAQTIKGGRAGTLKLAVASGVDLHLMTPHLRALNEAAADLDVSIARGTAGEIVARLKAGDVEIAVGDLDDPGWDRLDRWSLFDEAFRLVFSRTHRLANASRVTLDDLAPERILLRTHCDHYAPAALRLDGKTLRKPQDVGSDGDLFALLEANMGVAVLPATATLPAALTSMPVEGFALSRKVSVYAVAGRQRSPLAALFVKMLRAAAWPVPA